MENLALVLLLLVFVGVLGFLSFLNIYGIIASFKAKWYIGLVSLLVPAFAFVVGTAKFVFKKDLLN